MKNKIITMYELMGLIKDDKAPKKIKINNKIWFFYKSNKETLYIDNENSYLKSCSLNFNYYIDNKKLNETVEILPEENDECEDIEELGMICSCDYMEEIMRNRFIINKLIKNQKYLKAMIESIQRTFTDEIKADTPKWRIYL